MAISVGDLEAVLRLRNELSGQIRAATTAVQDATRAISAHTTQIEQNVSAIKKPLDEMAKGMQTTGQHAVAASKQIASLSTSGRESMGKLAEASKPLAAGFMSVRDVISKVNPLMSAFGVSLSIGAVVGFAKSIGTFAGQMTDLSAQTQISTDRLQAFNYVGAGVGLNIETITQNADQLARRLGGGDDSVTAALNKLNLSSVEMQNLGLDEIIFRVDKALVGVGNQYERARVLTDLFGRSGAQMGRLMTGSLQEVIEKAEDTSAVIDKDLIAKADAFDDAWAQGWIKFRGFAVEAIGAAASALQGLIDMADRGLVAGAFGQAARRGGTSPARIGGVTPAIKIDTTGLPQFRIENGRVVPGAPDFSDTIAGSGVPEVDSALEAIRRKAEETAAGYQKYFEGWMKEVSKATEAAGLATLHFALLMQEMATSPATRALQRLASGVQGSILPGVLTNLAGPGTLRGQDMLRGLMGLPGAVSDRGGVEGFLTGSQGRPLGIGESLFGRSVGGTRVGGAITDLPGIILDALTGGGNILQSVGGLLGSSVLGSGTGITKAATKGLSGLFGNTVGGAIGSILPGVGALLGPAISGLGKLFSNMFGGAGKKTNRERDAALFDFTGISGDKGAAQAAFREMAAAAGIAATEVDKLFSTKKVEDFRRSFEAMTQQINEFNDEQAADQARLARAVEKYGFSFEQLGPALQKQELDKMAKELIEDWRVLNEAGVDLGVVNERMAESFNEFLQMAIRTGTEIPSAMRPILESLMDQGLLTDEAGNAITDLEKAGVKFSETMTEGFDRVVKKLDELIAKLGLAAETIDAIGAPDITVPDVPGAGGAEMPGFARGTGGRYLNFGAGTAAVLHGSERVMTAAEGRAESGGWASVAASVDALSEQMARFADSVQRTARDSREIQRGRTA